MKFISPDYMHRYICKLANHIDIEFTADYEQIERSDKHYMIWNPYGYLAHPKKEYIDKYRYYKKLKEQNKSAYIVERGALPGTIFIDKNGFLFDSTSYKKENWDRELNENELETVKKYIHDFCYDDSSLESQKNSRLSEEDYFSKLDIDRNEYDKIVFVPLQLVNDTVTLLWCDWIKSVQNFQVLIDDLAENNPKVLFLVKNHPVNKDKNFQMKSGFENIKIVDELHYKDSLMYCDCVLTINSGVGLQAMMFAKPTIILGNCFYQFDTINKKANSYNEVVCSIYNNVKPYMDDVYKFIYYLKYVFYTECEMKKLSDIASKPVNMGRVSFESPDGQRISKNIKLETSEQYSILFQLISLLKDNYCLMKKTCLECLKYGELKEEKEELYIATRLNDEIKETLKDYDFEFVDNNVLEKKGIKIFIEEMPNNTKKMTLNGNQVNVPMPVLVYLKDNYGKDWRNYKLKEKEEFKVKDNLKIIYFFNNYGWAFEFESRYYQKHSSLEIIPMIDKQLPNVINMDVDMIVIPSAWHFNDLGLRNKVFINQLKKQGIFVVCQYNSELEKKFCTPTADLIIPSSHKIYNILKDKYKYTKMIWFPHFIDTDVFVPYNNWNDFTIGFCGNFKNRYKRPHIIEQLEQDFNFKKKCDYHGFLKPNRNHTEMVDFYNGIDIYISPSISEGTPLTMLEAMACGKIVFVTDTGIAPLVLDDFFVIPNTTDEHIYQTFKDRIDILKKMDVFKLKEIGQKNREKVMKLNWKDNVAVLDSIYKNAYANQIDLVKNISRNFIKEKFCE